MKENHHLSQVIPPKPKKKPWRSCRSILFSFCSIAAITHWLGSFSTMSLPAYSPSSLHFNAHQSFQISIFSDLHYGEDEHSFGPGQDVKSTALMRQVLAKENPNLVVIDGDLITGENTFAFNATDYIDQIVAPLVEGNYRWASTYGNHDSKFNLSREALFAEESKYTNALTQHGPAGTDGITNYLLAIYPPPTIKPKPPWKYFPNGPPDPIALLWFFDSRGGAEYQHNPPNADNIENYVTSGTVQWFRKTSKALKNQYGTLPSLAFVHIPILPFLDLQSRKKGPHVHGPEYPGLNADAPLAQQGYSDTGREAIPFMQALLETEGLHSVYSGHDHGDSWCGRWPEETLRGVGRLGKERPHLCFCKHSGYGGYGRWKRGVRQVRLEVDEQGGLKVDTWVRMKGGAVITAVSLNETYGEDRYSSKDGGYRAKVDMVDGKLVESESVEEEDLEDVVGEAGIEK